MSFFSEERSGELREIFFESAAELLQTLNEQGLELEKHPGDAEVVKSVRRTVHTLKGDSAACGFRELSEVAHELEDVLTPEIATGRNGALADTVLVAADTFSSMLSAYRANTKVPAATDLKKHIKKLVGKGAAKQAKLQPKFVWSEYERMVITEAASKGRAVYNVALRIDPGCGMQTAAIQMVRNVLSEAGSVLAMVPEENSGVKKVDIIEAALASEHDEKWLKNKCKIPAVISDIVIGLCAKAAPKPVAAQPSAAAGEPDLLDLEQETASIAPTAEEVRSAPMAHAASEAGPSKAAPAVQTESTLRVDADRIDDVLNLVGELIIGKSMLHQTLGEFDKRFPRDPLKGKFADAMAFQARVLNDLQKSVMKIRMVPVEQLFRRFPRVVRDVAKACGKEVELVITGENTDLDKSILDVLAEPMQHLARNAVDHGIESPEARRAAGKAAQGTIRLNAYHQGNQIVIEVADDGAGIDAKKVVAKAIERGLVSPEDAARMTESEQLSLIFHSGLSTAAEVTNISGRGVGMDVVRSVLERLKGTVQIQTKLGQGTTFLLKVPLTLAIIKALLFRVGERLYAVPLASVVEIARASEDDFHRVDDHEVMQLRDQVLTLVRLRRLARAADSSAHKAFVVVIGMADRKFGLIVDKLVGEEELVIKALDDQLVATDLVSGASILGDGTVVLILNLSSVISRLGRLQAAGASA